ncbi:hypothetical protein ACFWIB_15410 [Streptomyces sp. NPDC127051]|uniref:hypothetical protein n=1 Tax=Streptomyces sp. NPDC127051 TaxID=3347119 RepID=UPI00365B3242
MDQAAYEAFCSGAEICYTDCDDTCPTDGACATLCHELGKLPDERHHDPADCPVTQRTTP